jgi:hypothetical protein
LAPAKQVLEHKLRCLDAFLGQQAERRRIRGYKEASAGALGGGFGGAAGAGPGAPMSLFGGMLEDGSNRLNAAAGAAAAGLLRGTPVLDMPSAKRQRLWSAAVLEEQRNNAIRQLAARAAQALYLLRTLTGANVNRLVARLDDGTRRALKELVRDCGGGLCGRMAGQVAAVSRRPCARMERATHDAPAAAHAAAPHQSATRTKLHCTAPRAHTPAHTPGLPRPHA